MRLALDLIRLDGETQPRLKLDESLIANMTATFRSGLHARPIEVCFDGVNYWLVDGFHRVEATRRAGRKEIAAEVHDGDQRVAFLRALGNNSGVALTAADRKACAERMLRDPEWSKWSAREIGRHCGINHETVTKIKAGLSGDFRQIAEPTETKEQTAMPDTKDGVDEGAKVIPIKPPAIAPTEQEEPKKPTKRKATRNGKTYEIDTTNIGKSGKVTSKGVPRHVSVKAWTMLRGTETEKDPAQRRQMSKLAGKVQLQIARMIVDGDAPDVSTALAAMTGGAAVDDWQRAYEAVMKLPVDDRERLCRMVLDEMQQASAK